MGIWYTTREDVMSALDYKLTSRQSAQVDRAIEAGSRSVERLCHRKFFPELDTRYFDWPEVSSPSWRIWLGQNELISVSSVSSNGQTISPASIFLEPNDSGPPFTRLELDRGSSASFDSGNTPQRAVSITGLYGYSDDTITAGTAAEAMDASETGFDVSNGSLIGVGDLLKVDSERMIVTGRSWVSTGESGSLTSSNADQTLAVASGAAYSTGELLLMGAEVLFIAAISGNSLTVRRAQEGSPLQAHVSAPISASRSFTVTRGALGTTAATHLISAPVVKQLYPGPITSLTVAEAISQLQNELAGYGRTVGAGDNAREASGSMLNKLRSAVYDAYGRKARMRSV